MQTLASPNTIKQIMERYGFKFKKSLGQNFLIDQNIVRNICHKADISKEDVVVEIGPGIGTMTQELAKAAGLVIAVELDRDLIRVLEDNLKDDKNVVIVHNDVLKLNLDQLIATQAEIPVTKPKYKVVANLPYYITTPVIMHLLESKFGISQIVIMIQKEVAERIVAPPGGKDYGALTLAVQYYTEPEIAMRVPKTVFMPRPEVDSAILKLNVRENPPVAVVDEKLMFALIKAAFGQRRKTLLNALTGGVPFEKVKIMASLTEVGIDPGRRGETLALEEFAALANSLAGTK